MAELFALTRLAILSCRYVVITMLAVVALGTISFLIAANAADAQADAIAIGGLTCTLFPAAIAALVLFDYRSHGDLNSGQSGCDHWLLRLPVAAWKIAIIPALLKTIWVVILWSILATAIYQLDDEVILPFVVPPLAFSGGLIWTLTISWRPMRSDVHRGIVLLITLPAFYLGAVLVLAVSVSPPDRWLWYHETGLWIATVLFYLSSVWSLVKAIQLAKVSADGIIPAEATTFRFLDRSRDREVRRNDASAEDRRSKPSLGARIRCLLAADTPFDVLPRDYTWPAVALHDWLSYRSRSLRIVVFGCAPAMLIFAALMPLHTATVVLSIFTFSYLASLSIVGARSQNNDLQKTVYLATSPVRSATIAWSRCLTSLAIVTAIYSTVLFVFAGWALQAKNRESWLDWATDVSLRPEFAGSTIEVGLRLSIAIIIAWTVFFLGRIASFLWIGSTGRSWVAFVAAIASSLVYLVPFGLFLGWMIRQTDWETAHETALRFVQSLPMFLGILLTAKLGASFLFAAKGLRTGIVYPNEVFVIAAIWLTLWLVAGVGLWLLIPTTLPIAGWIAALAALAIPLARLYALPIAVRWNRHR